MTFGQDVRRKVAIAAAAAPGGMPAASDERFVNGSGDDFGRYLFRADVPNGRLTFHVDINRYYSNLMKFDAEGLLTNAPELIDLGLLPKKARFTLRIYDVDHNSQYDGNQDGIADPEVDYVYVNGKLITTNNGNPWTLGSGDNTFSTPSIEIPIEYFKFPAQPGSPTQKPSAQNLIEIAIDVPNTTYWAVQCDWMSLDIKNTIRPLVLIRGFGVSSGGSTVGSAEEAWATFGGFLKKDGIPYHIATSIDPCGSVYMNAWRIASEIEDAKTIFGVDKINLVGHSKGGIDSRAYLRIGKQAENLVQLGAPNHGSNYAYFSSFCQPAGDQMQPNWLANNFNFLNRNRNTPLYQPELGSGTSVYHLVGDNGEFFSRRGDGVVSLRRATLPWRAVYTTDMTEPDNVANNGAFFLGHSDLRQNQAVYRSSIQLIAPNIRTSARSKSLLASEESQPAIQASLLGSFTTAFVWQGTLPAGTTLVKHAYLSSADTLIVQTVLEDTLAQYTLKSPSGTLYTPASPEYFLEEGLGSRIKTYRIAQAEKGNWEIILKGGASAGLASVKAYIQTDKQLILTTNDKTSFKVNEPIPILASFSQGSSPIIQARLVAYFEHSSGKDSLELLDDGNHGDGSANDGVYGGQSAGRQDPGTVLLRVKSHQGAETLYAESLLTIVPASAEFTDSFRDNLQDTDSDGYTDVLQVLAGLHINQGGHYMVVATLRDTRDTVITQAVWSSLSGAPLSAGVYEIPLDFSGEDIGRNGKNGPFTVDDLVLIDLAYSIPVDYREKVYTTQGYDISTFPQPAIELTGKNSDTPIDSDNDGDYDFLDITIQLKVNRPGFYSFSAELIDSLQNGLNWAASGRSLQAGLTEITLRFDGQEINEKLANGPFTLTNFNLFSSANESVTFYNVFKTAAYSFLDFNGNAISSTVLNKITGLGIADAEVILGGIKLATAMTDTLGKFVIAGLPNGSYTLYARKKAYCDSPVLQLSIPLSQPLPPLSLIPQTISLSDEDTLSLCENTLTLTAPAGWKEYTWSTGETSQSIIVAQEGVYFMQASLSGCQAFSDTIVVQGGVAKPIVSADANWKLTSSSSSGNQWIKDGQPIAGATDQTYQATESGNYAVSVTINGCTNTSESLLVTISSELQLISSFTLVNADTNKDIMELKDNDTLNLAALPTQHLNIRANTNPKKVGAVIFDLDGKKVVEHGWPYAYAGGAGTDYAAMQLLAGNHLLTATPYSEFTAHTDTTGNGIQGVPLTIRFVVVYQKVESFTLVNADTNKDIMKLKDNDTLILAALPTQNLNIRANTSPRKVGAVIFDLDGNKVVEHGLPYAYAGGAGTDYAAMQLPLGDHTLTATPYSAFTTHDNTNGNGLKGQPLMITFHVSANTASARSNFSGEKPKNLALVALPNPFHNQTTVKFSVPESGYITLNVFDTRGVLIANLYQGYAESQKEYVVKWVGSECSNGIYMMMLKHKQYTKNYKLVLMK